jgi:mono/diheme cytochrome c family protein
MSNRIEIIVGFSATLLLVVALLFAIGRESSRIEAAQTDLLGTQLDDAMTLYAENCSVCHGLQGEGIGSTPSLDNEGMRGTEFDILFKTIARGRFDTSMPAWSKDDGGPLSDYQIGELVALIQDGDWTATGGRVVNLGLAPLVPFTAEPDPALFEQVGRFEDGAVLQLAIQTYAAQCVACHGPDGTGTSLAPAINSDATRTLGPEEILRTITFGSAGTLMAGWDATLTQDQINSLVLLIMRWDEIPEGAIPAPDVPIPVTEESLALGEELFSQNCSQCHGPEGQGTPRAPALNVKSFLTEASDLAIQQIITLGVPDTAMPAWGDRMSEPEIQAIVGFVRSWEPTAPEVATPVRGGQGPPWARITSPASTGADWRVVALVSGGLIAALGLIAIGFAGFKGASVARDPES